MPCHCYGNRWVIYLLILRFEISCLIILIGCLEFIPFLLFRDIFYPGFRDKGWGGGAVNLFTAVPIVMLLLYLGILRS